MCFHLKDFQCGSSEAAVPCMEDLGQQLTGRFHPTCGFNQCLNGNWSHGYKYSDADLISQACIKALLKNDEYSCNENINQIAQTLSQEWLVMYCETTAEVADLVQILASRADLANGLRKLRKSLQMEPKCDKLTMELAAKGLASTHWFFYSLLSNVNLISSDTFFESPISINVCRALAQIIWI